MLTAIAQVCIYTLLQYNALYTIKYINIQIFIDPVEVFDAWTKKYPDIAVAAAAIQALTSVIRTSTATTVMG